MDLSNLHKLLGIRVNDREIISKHLLSSAEVRLTSIGRMSFRAFSVSLSLVPEHASTIY